MSIVLEAKGLLNAAKKLQAYSEKLQEVASQLDAHNKRYEAASSDSEKQHHLKKHYITFSAARKIRDHYNIIFKEVEDRLKNIEDELKRIQI